ncbi:hypothetical protein J2Z62_000075 [Mycoplasmoides fastidiosum]|uniref:Uncharacterized protein n=1 Tax=Mycoplasmoides fastidiosum TaxID=92758 RepID=A0ABU0LY42_9BACT|nr:hypothetical protein [Mycoplasmoides fastidiosum]MDQ0513637.1 hypothetical protein [Mycoplasmoides fastidiosum]UUD37942.1 hypothetical protein NPA10_00905 [Mycoplasmoides fastidiosum]
MNQFWNFCKRFKKAIFAKIVLIFSLIPFFSLTNSSFLSSAHHQNLVNQKPQTQAAQFTATNNGFSPNSSSNSLSNFHFPTVEFVGGEHLSTYNVRNLYNVASSEFSLLYAKKKSASGGSTSSTDPIKPEELIDSLVYLNSTNNNVVWAWESSALITNLNTNRTSNGVTSKTAAKLILNKVVYSAASDSFFLAAAVLTSTDSSDDGDNGATVIFRIKRTDGVASVYFDSARNNIQMTNTGNVDYKNRPFSHLEINRDGTNPVLLLLRTQFYKSLSENSNTTTNANTKIRQDFVGVFVDQNGVSGGVNSLLNANLSPEDAKYLEDEGNRKIIVTNSFILDGALVLITQHKENTTPPTKATIYSFSLNGSRLNAPISTEINLISGKQTFFNLWRDENKTYLIGTTAPDTTTSSAQPSVATSGTASSSDTGLFMYELSMNLNLNNARTSATPIQRTIPHLNGRHLKGIVRIHNPNLLLPNTTYLALSDNDLLIGLDETFNFVSVLSLVNNYQKIGTNANQIIRLVKGVHYYLFYLSDGQIMAYDNGGFAGYVSQLSQNNGFELVTPIAFTAQTEIVDGAKYFTKSFSDFQSTYRQDWEKMVQYVPAYEGVKPNLEFDFIQATPTDTSANYSHAVTVNAYQRLRHLSADGTVNTTTNNVGGTSNASPRVFLGSYQYFLYNAAATVAAKTNVFDRHTVLASNVASFYSQPRNLNAAIDRFLNLTNVDIYDLRSNGTRNVTLNFHPNDTNGTLRLTVNIGHLWKTMNSTNTQLTNQIYDFTYNDFSIGENLNNLAYTLNPLNVNQIANKFREMSPADLKQDDLRNNFITLSNFLAAQKQTVQILPNEAEGNAVITLTFEFTNLNIHLPSNKDAISVTRNSITWKTDNVFKATPEINQAIALYFNTSQEIATHSAVTPSLSPSTLENRLRNAANLEDKIKLVVEEWGLVKVSPLVRNLIGAVSITKSQDLLGLLDLEIILTKPLGHTSTLRYSHRFQNFQRSALTEDDLFEVNVINKEDYLARFNPPQEQNLFNLVPSAVAQSDLLTRTANTLSDTNRILGGLITLSKNAADSDYSISLAPNDSKGELLVTLFFPNFIERTETITPGTTGQVRLVTNKRIHHVIRGFAPTQTTQTSRTEYFLSWKSFNDLETPNATSPGELAHQLPPPTELLASEFSTYVARLQALIHRVQLFAFISSAVLERYRDNPVDLRVDLTADDQLGTLRVDFAFNNWNFTEGFTSFSQTFSGFKINTQEFSRQVQTFDPLIPNALDNQELATIRSGLLASQIDASLLAKYFSFSGSILNNLPKIIYYVYDETIGTAQLLFFVQRPDAVTEQQTNSNPTPQTQAHKTIMRYHEGSAIVDADNNISFDYQFIPREELTSQGYVELVNSGIVLQGFQQLHQTSTRDASIIRLVLATLIPVVVFVMGMGIVIRFRNYVLVRNVKARISQQLISNWEAEYNRRQKALQLDKEITATRNFNK